MQVFHWAAAAEARRQGLASILFSHPFLLSLQLEDMWNDNREVSISVAFKWNMHASWLVLAVPVSRRWVCCIPFRSISCTWAVHAPRPDPWLPSPLILPSMPALVSFPVQLVDGEFILEADVEMLETIGVASNVAQQIVNAVQAQRQGLPLTQVRR